MSGDLTVDIDLRFDPPAVALPLDGDIRYSLRLQIGYGPPMVVNSQFSRPGLLLAVGAAAKNVR